MDEACQNTDRELFREPDETGNGDYYSNSLHVTEKGAIGMNVGTCLLLANNNILKMT